MDALIATEERIAGLDRLGRILDWQVHEDKDAGGVVQQVWLTIRHAQHSQLTTSGADEAEAFAKMSDLLKHRKGT